jgi:hypothetical protein
MGAAADTQVVVSDVAPGAVGQTWSRQTAHTTAMSAGTNQRGGPRTVRTA